jgi:hypothetical protein
MEGSNVSVDEIYNDAMVNVRHENNANILPHIQAYLENNMDSIAADLTLELSKMDEKPEYFTLTKEIQSYQVKFNAYYDWDDKLNRVKSINQFSIISY